MTAISDMFPSYEIRRSNRSWPSCTMSDVSSDKISVGIFFNKKKGYVKIYKESNSEIISIQTYGNSTSLVGCPVDIKLTFNSTLDDLASKDLNLEEAEIEMGTMTNDRLNSVIHMLRVFSDNANDNNNGRGLHRGRTSIVI